MLKLEELVDQASQSIGAKRVFGEPYEKNGVTIIPAARIMGGVGAGEGQGPAIESGKGAEKQLGAGPGGFGGGYGMAGRPAGAFVIKGDDVKWMPAIDVNRMMFGFQVVMIVFFLVIRSVMKARAQTRIAASK